MKTKHSHKHNTIGGKYLKDAVYGASDGIVTTFAIVAGVSGASLDATIVLILGFANLIADGFSMAAGNYLGTKSEQKYQNSERKVEEEEINYRPSQQTNEVKKIFEKKGFKGKVLEKIVHTITANKRLWIDTMLVEELGIIEERTNPKKAALATFGAFVIAGFMPLFIYVLASFINLSKTFLWACLITGLSLFVVGMLKAKITKSGVFKEAFEMLLVGGLAALVAYYVGLFLSLIVA